jgi:hypothetical protein
MSDIQHQSSQSPDQFEEGSNNENISAQLTITVDNQGFISYNCDWTPGENGIVGLASIFYRLLLANFSEEILLEIKQQCVSNDSEADYIAIINLINSYDSKLNKNDDNQVVIAPDQVYRI